MSGKDILVDTNIFLYLLNGNDTIKELLQGKNIFLSFITELELIGFKAITRDEEQRVSMMLNDCVVLSLNNSIKQEYVKLRKNYNLKLPDAIIAATAIISGLPLITADRHFKAVSELALVTYEL